MKIALLTLTTTLFLLSCNQINNKMTDALPKDTVITTTVITNDTIPETRTTVRKEAVASYTVPSPDKSNPRQFAVSVYETPLRFRFLLKMQYKTFQTTDTLKIPNFGIQPVVAIQKGNEPYACIIGFNDKKGEFRPYKQVSINGNQLKLTVLKSYFAGVYSTPQKQ